MPSCASQCPCVVRRPGVTEAVVVRPTGHLVETALPFLSLTIAIRENVVKPLPAISGLAEPLERKLVFVQETHQDAATAAVMWCTALVEASLENLEVHDFLVYGKGTRVAEQTVDATLTDDLAGVLRSRGATDAEELAVFLIGGVTALTDLAVLCRDGDRAGLLGMVERFVTATVST